MAATKNILAGSPSAADTLELGASGGIVQGASGCDLMLLDIGTIAAAGSDQTDAAALIHTINNVSGANGTVGVILPTAVAGLVRYVYTPTATHALLIYPGADDSINGGTHTTGAVSIAAKSLAAFVAISTSNWVARYTAS